MEVSEFMVMNIAADEIHVLRRKSCGRELVRKLLKLLFGECDKC